MNKLCFMMFLGMTLSSCVKTDSKIVNDAKTQLQWSKNISAYEMEWEEARKYCSERRLDDKDDWRLPTNEELETLINESLRDDDPESTERPFHGPFIVETNQFLFSGTPVSEEKGLRYYMRLDNGDIIKFEQKKAFVRCVRDRRFD